MLRFGFRVCALNTPNHPDPEPLRFGRGGVNKAATPSLN